MRVFALSVRFHFDYFDHDPCIGNTSIFSDRVDSLERALSCCAYSVGPTREFEECEITDRENFGEFSSYVISLESFWNDGYRIE